MSWEKYDDKCKGCQPVMINLETGKKLPNKDPAMKAIKRVWRKVPMADKQAWHEFTCQNSREPQILAVVERIQAKIQAAVKATEK